MKHEPTGPFALIVRVCFSIYDLWMDDQATGLKLGHWNDNEVAFYGVPVDKIDWLRQQLETANVPFVLMWEHVCDDSYRVIVTPKP